MDTASSFVKLCAVGGHEVRLTSWPPAQSWTALLGLRGQSWVTLADAASSVLIPTFHGLYNNIGENVIST